MKKKQKQKPINIYLDTCVLLDFLIKERKNDISKYVQKQLDGKKYIGIISDFSLLELKDNMYSYSDMIIKIKEGMIPSEVIQKKGECNLTLKDREKDNDEIGDFFERNKRRIKLHIINDNSGWKKAMELMDLENFSAPDSLHVASALRNKCQFILSKDKQLITCIENINQREKIIGIHYDKQTQIDQFISRFKNLSSEYESIIKGEEDKKAIKVLSDLLSFAQTKDYDPTEYEKEIMKNIRNFNRDEFE